MIMAKRVYGGRAGTATRPHPQEETPVTTVTAPGPTVAVPLSRVRDALDQLPRNAMGARVVLHDAACSSGCVGAAVQDHADRTQSKDAAALRRFRAQGALTS